MKRITICAVTALLIISCDKGPQELIKSGIPVITTDASEIKVGSALLNGYVNTDYLLNGGECGFIISTSSSPAFDNGQRVVSSEVDLNGKYYSRVTGLESSTTYFFKAFLSSGSTDLVGEIKSFTTGIVVATVTTGEVTNIETYSATMSGHLSADNNEDLPCSVWFLFSSTATTVDGLKESGVCLEASVDPNGDFSYSTYSLSYNTTYYYLACAKVQDKVFYGELKSFTTKNFEFAALDMGLSVKWANANLGATTPEGYGDYYAWGETDIKDFYYYTNYKWSNGSDYFLKYNTNSSYGVVDNLTVLDVSDDVAHVKLGGKWRMPTIKEADELISTKSSASYQWKWMSINGNKGWLVTYLVNNNSLFLPASGDYYRDYVREAGSYGYFWTSSLCVGSPWHAYKIVFCSSYIKKTGIDRDAGLSIRPVSD